MDVAVQNAHSLTASIEKTLSDAVDGCTTVGAPARLAQALRYAVFPGGHRLRPRLCLAVATSCGKTDLRAAHASAAAIELLHCASLVHDDLPCFDDAQQRRGKPSVHKAFGERIAVLTGDALIVLAFQTVAEGASHVPAYLGDLMGIVAGSVGMPFGIVAGQARECEPHVALSSYHLEKTGALFAAATMAGAAASGLPFEAWRTLGERLGLEYQVADDIRDVAGTSEDLGKPVGQDLALGRPSAALELGLAGAVRRLDELVTQAVESIPNCDGAAGLRALIKIEAKRFLPAGVVRQAA
jgi:geranylgeranyl diphosphate synthase type II